MISWGCGRLQVRVGGASEARVILCDYPSTVNLSREKILAQARQSAFYILGGIAAGQISRDNTPVHTRHWTYRPSRLSRSEKCLGRRLNLAEIMIKQSCLITLKVRKEHRYAHTFVLKTAGAQGIFSQR